MLLFGGGNDFVCLSENFQWNTRRTPFYIWFIGKCPCLWVISYVVKFLSEGTSCEVWVLIGLQNFLDKFLNVKYHASLLHGFLWFLVPYLISIWLGQLNWSSWALIIYTTVKIFMEIYNTYIKYIFYVSHFLCRECLNIILS